MPIPRPSQLRPEVPAALEAVVMKLLERDLDRRTRSASEAREALLAIEGAGAAFPTGQQALAAAVKRSLVEWPELNRRATEAALAEAETDVGGRPPGATDAARPAPRR